MTKLTQEKCVPCKGDTPPMTEDEINELNNEIPEWNVIDVDGVYHLERTFNFPDFAEALEFTNDVGEIAEEQGHHPVIELTWGQATVEWWTHNINGLHKNDFIMAAKTSKIYED